MYPSLAVSKRVKKLLKERQITFYELEHLSGLEHGSMSTIQNVTTKNITLKKIIQVCKGLNISLVDFFDDPIFDLQNFITE